MIVIVLVLLGVVTRFAGVWGVPYFKYVSDRGSPCQNTLTGFVCTPLTLSDVTFYSDAEFPDGTKVTSGSYRATHDYHLQARLEVPAESAAAAFAQLTDEFGQCQPDHPVPIATDNLTDVCVLANDDGVTRQGEPPSRIYVIGTGVRTTDGVRVIDLDIRSS